MEAASSSTAESWRPSDLILPATRSSSLSLTILLVRGVSGDEFSAATGGGCVLESGNGGDGVSAAVVRGEAAVVDGIPAVVVGEGNGVPAVADGGEVIANDTTGGEEAIADGVPTEAGGGEAISNDTTGGVGGADAGGAALHPLPPDCGSGAHVTFCW